MAVHPKRVCITDKKKQRTYGDVNCWLRVLHQLRNWMVVTKLFQSKKVPYDWLKQFTQDSLTRNCSFAISLIIAWTNLYVYIGWARTIYLYVYTVYIRYFSRGSPYIRSYTVCIYGYGQPYVYSFVQPSLPWYIVCLTQITCMLYKRAMLWWYAMKICYEDMLWRYAMKICYEDMLWRYAMKICYEDMLWRYAMKICYEDMLWRYAMKKCYEDMLWRYAMKICYEGIAMEICYEDMLWRYKRAMLWSLWQK
jgi:hypothetical protein